MTRTLVVFAALCSTASFAQVSATLSGQWVRFQNVSPPMVVAIEMNVSCGITCPMSAPTLHRYARGGILGYYAAEPTVRADYNYIPGTDLDDDGMMRHESASFDEGSTVFVKAIGVVCECGNGSVQTNFIEVTSQPFTIPLNLNALGTARAGFDYTFVRAADLKGSEQVRVTFDGAGLSNVTRTFGVADLNSQGYIMTEVRPTAAGTMTVTATMLPSNISTTGTVMVSPPNSTGTGGGSGSSGTGGGDGSGGGGADMPFGCSSAPGLLVVGLLGLLARRR